MTRSKVVFKLVKDTDDYPPFDTEAVWASSTDGVQYKIDNIPFFARQATIGDVILVRKEDGQLVFDRVVERSRSSLIRVVVFAGTPAKVKTIRTKLKSLGCATELFREPAVIAVDIPGEASLSAVQAYLSDLENRQVITYEEPILRHP